MAEDARKTTVMLAVGQAFLMTKIWIESPERRDGFAELLTQYPRVVTALFIAQLVSESENIDLLTSEEFNELMLRLVAIEPWPN